MNMTKNVKQSGDKINNLKGKEMSREEMDRLYEKATHIGNMLNGLNAKECQIILSFLMATTARCIDNNLGEEWIKSMAEKALETFKIANNND